MLITKNLIQNALKAMKNPEACISIWYLTMEHTFWHSLERVWSQKIETGFQQAVPLSSLELKP